MILVPVFDGCLYGRNISGIRVFQKEINFEHGYHQQITYANTFMNKYLFPFLKGTES